MLIALITGMILKVLSVRKKKLQGGGYISTYI